MDAVVAVAVGGGLGSALRYLISTPINERVPALGTAFVNVVRSLALGLVVGWATRTEGNETLRLALGTGLLGGFTTFSAWMGESVTVFERPLRAVVTIALPVLLGVVAAWAGVRLGRGV